MPRPMRTSRRPNGFSLIELVIVVVIIGIIGAIAIPRLSRGAGGANASALKQDLLVMNKAIDLYAAEHGGAYPTMADFEGQMMTYSNQTGDTQSTPSSTHTLGPYLRAIPPAPGGAHPGSRVVASGPGDGVGWIYHAGQGRVVLNRGMTTNANAEDTALGRLLDKIGL